MSVSRLYVKIEDNFTYCHDHSPKIVVSVFPILLSFVTGGVGELKTTTFGCPNIVQYISRHRYMYMAENTSEQVIPALAEAISTILSEVKASKDVTTLKESVEL